jgi:GDP-D-mannose dehydratase
MSSFITPIYTLNINVVGTTNLLEELRIARDRGICDPIIISVSSSEVYGNPRLDEIPIKETNPIRAANPYSISKVAHDLLSQMYHQAYGLKIIITRMFSHEGARRGRMFAISNFAYQIVQHEKEFRSKYTTMNNKKVTLVHWPPPVHSLKIKVGNLNSVRTYSHIDDAVRAYWICAIDGEVGNVYNIGGDYTCTVGDVLDNLLHKSVLPFESFFTEIDPGRIRLTDITLQIPDCAKFKHLTGWKPKKSLDDITTDLLNYWREML